MGKAIALATPVFFLLIALELIVARARGMGGAYRLNDAINSLSLGVMSQVIGLFVRVFNYGVYALVFEHVAQVLAQDRRQPAEALVQRAIQRCACPRARPDDAPSDDPLAAHLRVVADDRYVAEAGLDAKAMQQLHGHLGVLRVHLTRLKDHPLDETP